MTAIDRSMLKLITQASLEVYDLAHRVQDLSQETKQVLGQAEELLRASGLAFLMGDAADVLASEITGDPAGGDPAGGNLAECMVDAYIQAQQGLSDLKDALYRLAQAALAQGKPAEAQEMLQSLEAISPGYRDVQDMLRRTGAGSFAACLEAGEFDKANDQLLALLRDYPGVFDEQEMRQRLVLAQARKLFTDRDHDGGRELLRKYLVKHPRDVDVRLEYLLDYLDEILWQLPTHPKYIYIDPLPNLERLQKVELPSAGIYIFSNAIAVWQSIIAYAKNYENYDQKASKALYTSDLRAGNNAYEMYNRYRDQAETSFTSQLAVFRNFCNQIKIEIEGFVRNQKS